MYDPQAPADTARALADLVRARTIAAALDYLANVAAPTATGATVRLPSGGTLYLSADLARAMCSGQPTATAGHA